MSSRRKSKDVNKNTATITKSFCYNRLVLIAIIFLKFPLAFLYIYVFIACSDVNKTVKIIMLKYVVPFIIFWIALAASRNIFVLMLNITV
jgi:hypothetical protein